MATSRLTPTDWILAAFRRLSTYGPAGLKVEPLAREVGATKGSFYHHFEGPTALRDAMLAHWEGEATQAIVDALADLPEGAPRLRGLADLLDRALDPAHGGVTAEAALRDWGRTDAKVAQSVAEMDARRLDFVAENLCAAGIASDPAARLIYAADLGLNLLPGAQARGIGSDVHFLLDMLGLPR